MTLGRRSRAPDGPHYHQVEFEQYEPEQPVAAIVASNSLHHVSDLDTVVELITRRLDPGGVLVVVEWDWERFDEATARWCFDRLADAEPGWLHRHRDEWLHSGQSWETYRDGWARTEGLHTGQDILRSLNTRFDTRLLASARTTFPISTASPPTMNKPPSTPAASRPTASDTSAARRALESSLVQPRLAWVCRTRDRQSGGPPGSETVDHIRRQRQPKSLQRRGRQ